MHSLLWGRLEAVPEKKKADFIGQSISKEGRRNTKEAKSKMFAFLPDVDLDVESWCARKNRK